MERACFDGIMIEDTVMVADTYGGTIGRFAEEREPARARYTKATVREKLREF